MGGAKKNTKIGSHRPCVRCAAIRIALLAFILVTFVPCGTAEWPARVDTTFAGHQRFTGLFSPTFRLPISGAAKRGVSNGLPDLDLSFFFCPFLSFLGLSRFFRDFPDLLGDGPGIFLIRPFSLVRSIKSTYEEQSWKGPRHNLDLSRKKWETPGFRNPPV